MVHVNLFKVQIQRNNSYFRFLLDWPSFTALLSVSLRKSGLSGKKTRWHSEMRMIRWMCDVKVKDKVPSKELRERLGIDDIILVL